jgi:hypothetical protein
MTPDDLDTRLRRALHEVSSAWQPNAGSAIALVDSVNRRRVRRHRSALTVGCAMAAAIAVVGTGVFSTSAKTDNRVASGAGLRGQMPSAGSSSTTSAGHSPVANLPSGTNTASECASVTVDSGVSRCAGVSANGASIQGIATSNSAAGASSATPSPASIPIKVGQHVTMSLPATTAGFWGLRSSFPPRGFRQHFARSYLSA